MYSWKYYLVFLEVLPCIPGNGGGAERGDGGRFVVRSPGGPLELALLQHRVQCLTQPLPHTVLGRDNRARSSVRACVWGRGTWVYIKVVRVLY